MTPHRPWSSHASSPSPYSSSLRPPLHSAITSIMTPFAPLTPVEDKTRAFNSALAATLSSFMLRQEAEILKIPRDLRSMTLGQLEAQWGGSWAGTVQRIAREKMEEREREEAAQREKARLEEEAKGKRWV